MVAARSRRLERKGPLRAEWGTSELERRAKFYHLGW
jgi:hypothetical protein